MPRPTPRAPVHLPPGGGRAYDLGPVRAVFKADGAESADRYIAGDWIDAPAGSFVVAPGGTEHDFENRTAARAGALNISVPGGFEPHMDGIAAWFRARPAAEARTADAPPKGDG